MALEKYQFSATLRLPALGQKRMILSWVHATEASRKELRKPA